MRDESDIFWIFIAKKRKEYTLEEIAKGVEKLKGISLYKIRTHNKLRHVTLARKLFIIVARGYGYKEKDSNGE